MKKKPAITIDEAGILLFALYDSSGQEFVGRELAVKSLVRRGLLERNPTAKHLVRRTEKATSILQSMLK